MRGAARQRMDGLGTLIGEVIEHRNARLTVSRLGNRASLADLDGKRGYLMVSVKNSSFTTGVVETFCDLAETHFAAGDIILFDKPYAAPILAGEADGPERRRKLDNLRKAASDRRRFLETILSRRRASIPLRSFAQVEAEVAPALRWEVREAFEAGGQFRLALLERSRAVLPAAVPDELLPRYAEFLVSEIPVLCHLYYAHCGPSVVDVYPGENPELFWDIERGRFADELPQTTALAKRSPGLIFVDVSPPR